MTHRQGTITAPSNLNIQEHEMATARALADAGYDVLFEHKTQGHRVTSADVVIDGVLWEMKSPESSGKKTIERNLRKATRQSDSIIFDSQRMKGMADKAIEHELRRLVVHIRAIRNLIEFVS